MTTKQKNIRDYIIGLVVIAILICALIFCKEKNDLSLAEQSQDVELYQMVSMEGESITDMKVSDIAKVSYTLKDKETVVIEKVGEDWVINGDKDFPFSQDSFKNQFLQRYIDGQMYATIDDYDNLSDYGMDEPSATLEVVDTKGNKRTYLIGAYNSVISSYYIYHKEEDKLYAGTQDFLYICRDDIYDFAEIDTFPSFSTTSLDYMIMNNGEKKVEFLYLPKGHESDPLGNSTWFINSPFSYYRACESSVVIDNFDEVFTGVGFSQKVDYYATDEELEAYGLKNSDKYYEIVYKFQDDEDKDQYEIVSVKVLFGNYDEEADAYYARVILTQGMEIDVERARSINFISRTYADKILNIDPVDYIYPFMLYVPMKDFAGGGMTVIDDGGIEYKFEYEAEYKTETSTIPLTESMKFDGQDIDVDAFKEFYYKVVKIYVNRVIYEKDKIVDCEPTYVFKYDRVDDDYFGDAVMEFREYDATYYQVSINGVVDSLAVRRDVDSAVEVLKELK